MTTTGIRLSSTAELIGKIETARSVTFGSYVLFADSAVVDALADAARNGARVTVRLGALMNDGSGKLHAKNEAAARRLTANGAVVVQTAGIEHLKAAVVDGVAFLDDRNWAGSQETVLRDERSADVNAVRKALESGKPVPASRDFALGKSGALRLESDTIARTHGRWLDVESETITPYSPIVKRLVEAARTAHVRLIVAKRESRQPLERKALAHLVEAGVEVHTGPQKYGGEKFCVTGDQAWVGSANATGSFGRHQPLDWGLSSRSHAIANALHKDFVRAWRHTNAYVAPKLRESGARGLAGLGVAG
jgi:hypothetical protein